MNKNAVIIGASSGIGKALALKLSQQGYNLALCARRYDRLEALQKSLETEVIIQQMDVTNFSSLPNKLDELSNQLRVIDLVIICAGTGHHNPDLKPDLECDTIDTNVTGFTVLSGIFYQYFKNQGHGHVVGISSILALRGGSSAPAYNASKAYMLSYMQGLRIKSLKENLNINVTDIRPGYVDTIMAQSDNIFWMASKEKAVKQIIVAINKKKPYAYVTKRWRIFAWFLKVAPDSIYKIF